MLRLLRCPLNEPSELGASLSPFLQNVLKLQDKKNKYSFTAVSNFCTTVGLMGTDSGQLYIRRKTPSTAVDIIAHETDYGLEFCWLSVSPLQQLIAVITAAVLHLFGRCAWRHSGLRSWWSILRMRTATLILWYVWMYTNTKPNGVLIALQSLKNQTLLSKLEMAPLLAEPLVNTVSSLSDESVSSVFVHVHRQRVQMWGSLKTQLHFLLYLSKWNSIKWLIAVPHADQRWFQ